MILSSARTSNLMMGRTRNVPWHPDNKISSRQCDFRTRSYRQGWGKACLSNMWHFCLRRYKCRIIEKVQCIIASNSMLQKRVGRKVVPNSAGRTRGSDMGWTDQPGRQECCYWYCVAEHAQLLFQGHAREYRGGFRE